MTPEEFKRLRRQLGHSQTSLAAHWGMGSNGSRSIRRWEQGDVPLNPIAAFALEAMSAGFRPGRSREDD